MRIRMSWLSSNTIVEMEYDEWQSAPLQRIGPATFAGMISLAKKPASLDFVTVHQHADNGSTLTFSSPLIRAKIPQ